MLMNYDYIKGVIVPILTPINEQEQIDEAKLRKMVNYVISGGVHGILVYGSNGEFYGVEDEDFERGIRIVMDEAHGRVPVYVGIGSVTTKRCIANARLAAECGVNGISLLQPMFLAPSENELYRHFETIAGVVPEVPVLLYNNPRVGYGISPQLAARLNSEIENIVGIKDSSGDMTTLAEYVRLTRGSDFKVLGGKDTLIFAALAQGAVGCVATTANFLPNYVADIYNHFVAGAWDSARDAQFRLTPIRKALDMSSFPVGTKDIANLMGLDVGNPFLPNLSTSGEQLGKIKSVLIHEGVL